MQPWDYAIVVKAFLPATAGLSSPAVLCIGGAAAFALASIPMLSPLVTVEAGVTPLPEVTGGAWLVSPGGCGARMLLNAINVLAPSLGFVLETDGPEPASRHP